MQSTRGDENRRIPVGISAQSVHFRYAIPARKSTTRVGVKFAGTQRLIALVDNHLGSGIQRSKSDACGRAEAERQNSSGQQNYQLSLQVQIKIMNVANQYLEFERIPCQHQVLCFHNFISIIRIKNVTCNSLS
jgi:hypothetical protein